MEELVFDGTQLSKAFSFQNMDRLFPTDSFLVLCRSGFVKKLYNNSKLDLENAEIHVPVSLMELKVSYQHISLGDRFKDGAIFPALIIAAITNRVCITLRLTEHNCAVICPLMAPQNDRLNGFMKVKSDLNC